jgi:hypothetical protein
MLLNKDTSMIEIFPLLNLLRDEGGEKLTQIGRPKGSKSSSKFDVYHGQIITLMSEGLSVSAVARDLGVSRSSLKDYIISRGIKELLESVGKQMHDTAGQRGMDNIILVCPFDKEEQQT